MLAKQLIVELIQAALPNYRIATGVEDGLDQDTIVLEGVMNDVWKFVHWCASDSRRKDNLVRFRR